MFINTIYELIMSYRLIKNDQHFVNLLQQRTIMQCFTCTSQHGNCINSEVKKRLSGVKVLRFNDKLSLKSYKRHNISI